MTAPNGARPPRFHPALWQLALILVAWLLLAGLHWENDGLWYQGDAPRHAANGLFWKDFLLSGSFQPQEYALRYYARYPVITPIAYPPAFYLLEAVTFGVFGPSPYAAKGLVLLFALLAAFYLLAWLRRWVSPGMGWAAALIFLLPGYVRWSHVVLLNVPATALSLAALYHARRWMESPRGTPGRRQLYWTVGLGMLATLTYLPAGVVAAIIVAWLLASQRGALVWNRRTIVIGAAGVLLVVPYLILAKAWAPIQLSFITEIPRRPWTASGWTFYLKHLPILVSPHLLLMAAAGAAFGIWHRRWRRESVILLVFLGVDYAALSALIAKEGRYGLLLCVPILCFCAMAFHCLSEWLRKRTERTRVPAGALMLVLALIVCGTQAWIAAHTYVARLQGFQQVVRFIEQAAPDEPVFYDGHFDGVFTFLVQAGDPGYRRRVVLGAKLLYVSAMVPLHRYQSYAASPAEVVQRLQANGGCRWLVVERSMQAEKIPGSRLLREALRGPEFELVRSFPISGSDIDRVDVYRFKAELQPVEYVDLPFPILGEDARYRVRPIQR